MNHLKYLNDMTLSVFGLVDLLTKEQVEELKKLGELKVVK